VDDAAGIPLSVVQLDLVAAATADFELVRSEHLSGQAPRLAAQQSGIVGGIERIGFLGPPR